MADEQLYRYFERELALLRKSCDHFAQQHPRSAEGMRLNEEHYEDPNITRLIESVALLSARCHRRIDQQLPHLSSVMSSTIFPSLNLTLPSVISANFQSIEADFSTPIHLEKNTKFTAVTQQQEKCTFSLCHNATLSPITVQNVEVLRPPYPFEISSPLNANAAIAITINTLQEEASICEVVPDDLQIYVNGFSKKSCVLSELILSQLTQIVISSPEKRSPVTLLNADHWIAEVADSSFRVLPYHANESSVYMMLLEYLNYSEKSKFFRIVGFKQACQKIKSKTVIITFMLRDIPNDFMQLIGLGTLYINTCMFINAFETRSEPIPFSHQQLSEPILATANKHETLDILEVNNLVEITPDGEQNMSHLFRQTFFSKSETVHWHTERTDESIDAKQGPSFNLYISHIDTISSTIEPQLFSATLLCSNGLTPTTLLRKTEVTPEEKIDILGVFHLLETPFPPLPPQLNHLHQWHFFELISNNFSNLMNTTNPVKKLQQMLAIFSRSEMPTDLIASIQNITYTTALSRLRIEGKTVLVTGTKIALTVIEPRQDSGPSFTLFLHLLNKFFGEFCSFDRFIELHVDVLGGHGSEHITFDRIHGVQQCL